MRNDGRLGPDAGARALDLVHKLLTNRPSTSTVVVCTHREVLVEVLPGLATEFGVALGHRPPGAKGSYWVLRFREGRLANAKYSHPSPRSP